jgi:hypothetical protein
LRQQALPKHRYLPIDTASYPGRFEPFQLSCGNLNIVIHLSLQYHHHHLKEIDAVLCIREGTFGRTTFWGKQMAAKQMEGIFDTLQQHTAINCCTLFITGECSWQLLIGSLLAVQGKYGEHTAISWLVCGGNQPYTAVASCPLLPHVPLWGPGAGSTDMFRFGPSSNDTNPPLYKTFRPLSGHSSSQNKKLLVDAFIPRL